MDGKKSIEAKTLKGIHQFLCFLNQPDRHTFLLSHFQAVTQERDHLKKLTSDLDSSPVTPGVVAGVPPQGAYSKHPPPLPSGSSGGGASGGFGGIVGAMPPIPQPQSLAIGGGVVGPVSNPSLDLGVHHHSRTSSDSAPGTAKAGRIG